VSETKEVTAADLVAVEWTKYRARSQAIPPLPWNEFLERDEAYWRDYLRAEATIRADRTLKGQKP
jgi:hypothetical protein